MAGETPQEPNLIIFACTSPNDLLDDAPVIAPIMGCGTHHVAFDLMAACLSFCLLHPRDLQWQHFVATCI